MQTKWARETSLGMDEYFPKKHSFQRIQLSRIINIHIMSVRVTDDKHFKIKNELWYWHKHRKNITLMQGVILCNTLEYWDNTNLYARFIFSSLQKYFNHSIHSSRQTTIDSK